ncbi:glycosyltransferase family 2 protein [Halalkalicoccus tibetensis]|uniref:Glycosyltransferase family 2 protein n=1 Tax=Halalkalicoccus tibetensis TaxID=175632 RepID=A0ABD5V2X9_9EURY
MYRDQTVGVVIPAYNEEGFIGGVLRDIPEYVDRIYVIDDCSTDKTWDEIISTAQEVLGSKTAYVEEQINTANKQIATDGGTLAGRAFVHEPIGCVLPIEHLSNFGAGGAIKTGYLAALQDKTDVVVTIDGDGQMDLDYLPRLLDPIVNGKADYAKANRLLYQEYRQGMSGWRFFGNSILTFLTKIASGYWKMMDPQNGYTAASHHALDNIGVEGMYEYYGYCNDILVKLNAKGLRLADVAIPGQYGDEESSIRYPEYIRKVSSMLLRNFLWRLKIRYFVLDFHPLGLFYLFGAITAVSGFTGMSWSTLGYLLFDQDLFIRMALSTLLFLMGSMFLMFAMLFDMQANENRELQVYE